MSDPRIARLPRWAQRTIATLEERNDRLEGELHQERQTVASQETWGKLYLDNYRDALDILRTVLPEISDPAIKQRINEHLR